ncbi:MAG TPA: VOC family protein [Cellulomonas sp.]
MHHVEVWVDPGSTAVTDWAWLLGRVGFTLRQEWPEGQTWAADDAYLTLTSPVTLTDPVHERRRAGVNHLALRAGAPAEVDAVMAEASAHGWTPLYQDRYPHAGGPDHYAGWLENAAGFKAELVAQDPTAAGASTQPARASR